MLFEYMYMHTLYVYAHRVYDTHPLKVIYCFDNIHALYVSALMMMTYFSPRSFVDSKKRLGWFLDR